jgi:hypothetical protein
MIVLQALIVFLSLFILYTFHYSVRDIGKDDIFEIIFTCLTVIIIVTVLFGIHKG